MASTEPVDSLLAKLNVLRERSFRVNDRLDARYKSLPEDLIDKIFNDEGAWFRGHDPKVNFLITNERISSIRIKLLDRHINNPLWMFFQSKETKATLRLVLEDLKMVQAADAEAIELVKAIKVHNPGFDVGKHFADIDSSQPKSPTPPTTEQSTVTAPREEPPANTQGVARESELVAKAERSFVERHGGKLAAGVAVLAAGGWALHEMNRRSESQVSTVQDR